MRRTFLSILFSLVILSVWAVSYPYHPPKKIAFTSSDLPIVVIQLDEPLKDRGKKERSSATITILERQDGSRNLMSDMDGDPDFTDKNIFNYHGKIGIRYRGSSSFSMSDKKPLQVRTENPDGSKRPANILNLGADDNWTFLAPYADKSLMRDVLVFDLSRGYFEYTPQTRYCEVVLEGVYQGIYIIAARARKGDYRLQLPKPGTSGDALTGGYLLDIDRNDDPGFYSGYKARNKEGQEVIGSYVYYQYEYPNGDDILPVQEKYIENAIRRFEDVMNSDNYTDPVNGYRAYIDSTSAIDYILTEELTHNVDGYRLSTPIYKYNDNRDPRLKFSIWDFNLSFGNNDYMGGHYTFGWGYLDFSNYSGVFIPFWFRRLMDDPMFHNALRKRWCQYRSSSHTIEHIYHKIDSISAQLSEAQERNFDAWGILGKYVWPNVVWYKTWEEEIEYLKKYISDRAEWIDNEFKIYPIEIENGTSSLAVACEDFEVTVTADPAPEGMAFYYWAGDDYLLDNPNSPTAGFAMPSSDVYLSATYRPTIDIEKAEAAEKIFVYPNPAGEYIKISSPREGETYTINNQVGQTLLSGIANKGEAIDISALPSGAYIAKAGNGSMLFIKK